MNDIADRAQEEEVAFITNALRAHGQKQQKGLTHCEDCDTLIPIARRRAVAGCRRCVTCQHDFERLNKGK